MRRALFALLLPVAVTVASCLGPTEIVVTITTNACPSLQRADIYVDGAQVASASQPACDPNDPFAEVEVGTINVVPSKGIDSQIDVTIVGAVGGACTTPDTQELQCIVARRTLSFIPHTRLDLPIELEGACAGVHCDDPTQTCVVDSNGAHCGSTCGVDTVPCQTDAGSGDTGPIADVIVTDALPPVCPSPFPFPTGPATLSWSFENVTTDGTLHDDKMLVAPAPPLVETSTLSSSPPTFCNRYLKAQASQALVTLAAPVSSKLQTSSFSLGFAFVTQTDATILQLASSAQFGGFDIGVVNGVLVVHFESAGTSTVFKGTAAVNDGHWHRFAMDVTTATGTLDGGQPVTTLQPYVEGVALKSFVTPSAYLAASAGLFVGGIDGIDQITFTAK